MEITTESEIYAPNTDDAGNYVDAIPSFSVLRHGIRCPCGSRKDKVYDTHSVFSSHIKTKTHLKWLAALNANRTNFYIENESLKTTIQNQRIIIAKMEKDLQNKIMTIDYLTQQLAKPQKQVNNLLEFD
jgi:hypothetical protein